MLIGISGWARAGKSAAGKILRDHHQYQVETFDAPVKEVARTLYGTDFRNLDKDLVIQSLGMSPRQIYQTVGHDIFRSYDPAFWLNHLIRRVDPLPANLVITDVRYCNEADWILAQGGEVWRIVSDRAIHYEHPSEHTLDDYEFNRNITNNGSLDLLGITVDEILHRDNPLPEVKIEEEPPREENMHPRPKVHLDPLLHAQVKDFCRANNIGMKPWADKVLAAAIAAGMVTPSDFRITRRASPVAKKPLPTIIETPENAPRPEEAPPFWATAS